MEDFQPLSVRRGIRPPFQLHEGVPEHLATQLGPLLMEAFIESRALAQKVAAYLEIPLDSSSWSSTLLVNNLLSDDGRTLDAVDMVVRFAFEYLHRSGSTVVQEMRVLFNDAHSVWKVDPARGQLVRRVSEEASTMYANVQSSSDATATHLSDAWRAVFSRESDPSKGWSSATKALESALAPIVAPKNDRPQYGVLVSNLHAKPEKWDSDMPGDSPAERVMKFVALLKLVPYSPDRHGTKDFPRIDEGTARSVVLIATSILEILRQGGLRRV